MKISSRFTIALHTLLCIEYFQGQYKITSDFIASSVNVNPVIIRQILCLLKAAGFIEVKRGSGGAKIIKPLAEISLLDIYQAVDCVENNLFNFHNNPNLQCPVGQNIHFVLDGHLKQTQTVFEKELAAQNLAQLMAELQEKVD